MKLCHMCGGSGQCANNTSQRCGNCDGDGREPDFSRRVYEADAMSQHRVSDDLATVRLAVGNCASLGEVEAVLRRFVAAIEDVERLDKQLSEARVENIELMSLLSNARAALAERDATNAQLEDDLRAVLVKVDDLVGELGERTGQLEAQKARADRAEAEVEKLSFDRWQNTCDACKERDEAKAELAQLRAGTTVLPEETDASGDTYIKLQPGWLATELAGTTDAQREQDWRCPECRCREFARVAEQKADGRCCVHPQNRKAFATVGRGRAVPQIPAHSSSYIGTYNINMTEKRVSDLSVSYWSCDIWKGQAVHDFALDLRDARASNAEADKTNLESKQAIANLEEIIGEDKALIERLQTELARLHAGTTVTPTREDVVPVVRDPQANAAFSSLTATK